MPLLLPGSYRVEASRSGFKQSVKSGLRVTVTETTRLDIRLEPGAPQDSIEVRTEAEPLQTESTSLGRVTDRALLTNLPLATRNYTQIIALSPGIMAEVTSAAELGPGSGGYAGGNFRAHGAASRDNNFQMNGLQINDLQTTGIFSGSVAIPSPDAIEEFKVQTGLYDASFGRNAGASVNVVTRGGTNRFHGTAFEFLRNEALNANEFFRNAAGQPRGVLRQNQFGGTLGGPIRRDKLLFFVSYQGTRQLNGLGGGGTSNFYMPALTSDRSRVALGALFAGQRGFYQEQDGGVGPAVAADGSNISPQAFALLNRKLPNGEFVIPTPHRVDPARPFATRGFAAFSVPAPFAENQFIANLDLLHTARSKLVGRFFYAENDLELPLPGTNIGGPPAPGFPFRSPSNLRNLSLGHGYTFGPTVFNQADFGFHRIFVPTVQEEPFKWSDVGVRAPSHADPYPALAIQGSLTLGGNGQGLNTAQNHFTFQDAFTVVRGRHTLRIGGGLTRSQINRTGVHYYSGLVFFSWPDLLLGLPAGDPAAGGNGTRFSSIYRSVDLPGLFDRGWRILDANAYVQDDLRLTSTLTLNLGARYERLGHFGDIHGRNSGFDIALADPDPPAGGTLAGFLVSKNFQGAVPAGVTRLDNTFGIRGAHPNNFDPRVGLAWRLPRTALPFTGRMVLRGGFGIYHTRATGQAFLQQVINPPFGVLRSLEGEANGRATFADPFQGEMTLPQFTPYSPTSRAIGRDRPPRLPTSGDRAVQREPPGRPRARPPARGGLRRDEGFAPDHRSFPEPGPFRQSVESRSGRNRQHGGQHREAGPDPRLPGHRYLGRRLERPVPVRRPGDEPDPALLEWASVPGRLHAGPRLQHRWHEHERRRRGRVRRSGRPGQQLRSERRLPRAPAGRELRLRAAGAAAVRPDGGPHARRLGARGSGHAPVGTAAEPHWHQR